MAFTIDMEWAKLKKPELIQLSEELGLEVVRTIKKQQLIAKIRALDLENEEIIESWEEVEKRNHDRRRELDLKEKELELRRLELEQRQLDSGRASSEGSSQRKVESFKMSKLMQPFKVGEDIGLFLVNFERTCEKLGFRRETWSQRLLTLLPCEAADVVARLSKEDAEMYEKAKASLLRKYRLTTEAFRQRFRSMRKKPEQGYPELAYDLRANLIEWLKSADVYGEHDKVVECVALEQFYRCLPDAVRFWLQDKPDVNTVERAGELAEEYASRRKAGEERPLEREARGEPKKPDGTGKWPAAKAGKRNGEGRQPEQKLPSEDVSKESRSSEKGKPEREKSFEKRKPPVCYNCQESGHIAAGCRKPKVVFHYVDDEENRRLLEPYVHDLRVNGSPCRVLRDCAATIDVMHPSLVRPDDYTGECAWIKQAVEGQKVCLPIARVSVEGPFGKLETEAAVSRNLPLSCPYLFSNKSDQMLRKRGLVFSERKVQALTRARARQIAAEVVCRSEDEVPPSCQSTSDGPSSSDNAETTSTDKMGSTRHGSAAGETGKLARSDTAAEIEEGKIVPGCETGDEGGLVLSPSSRSFHALLQVDRELLIEQQQSDPSLTVLHDTAKDGISRRNVSYQIKAGVLYRHYKDRKGRVLDQLVVPQKYRSDLLELSHGSSWSGHLGIKKTKDRLLQEYYWPGCFRDAENFVRSCDACQRVGKPHEKNKAPLRLVPLITEPFRRLVIDTVGPLPVSKSGYKYVLTLLCPATKFPEACPLKELSSAEIVDALLSVFARIGFPAEIQSDQGSVFTSALTNTFLEKCGIRVVHSSVYHPQSNAVEKWHSVFKRVLRALCFEQKVDWEACLPATMFALRTVPHEATGFSPAELVYGRSLRSPLRMLRESWEGQGEDQTVVEYVLKLLDRMHKTQEVVEANMQRAQAKAKLYYDRGARERKFEVGDQVMLLRVSKKNKLEVQWEGPAKVLQKLSETNYAVESGGKRKKVRIYHCNLLKPYVGRKEIVSLAWNTPEEVPTEIPTWEGKRGEYDVDTVIAKAVKTDVLTEDQLSDLRKVISEFEGLFSDRPGRTNLVCHDIELTESTPVRSKAYRVSPRRRDILAEEIERMLRLGVIEAAESDYTSPLILVEVPGKDPRPCIDYRRLNTITRDQTYPIPNIEERVERVSAARYISTLDLIRGYWQVPLTERASRYAAFISPLGTFRPLMLSFGLKNAPFCFSKLMDSVLRGTNTFALPYLDDIAIFSATWQEHVSHLREVFRRLREAGLTVKAEKCQLGQAEVTYLGHVIGQGCRRPSEIKVAAVGSFPRPETKTQIRSFLGLTGYYQRYVANYSQVASPLTDALRKNEPNKVGWDEKKEQAFQSLKKALTERPVLRAPDYDQPFFVQCDASDRGMGVVLCQKEGDEEHPILYASRKLTTREEAYSASEKECACLVWAAQKLSCYLAGAPFTFETDHCPLTWLQQMSPKNGRLLRWSLALQEFNFRVTYKRGKLNSNADTLSRMY